MSGFGLRGFLGGVFTVLLLVMSAGPLEAQLSGTVVVLNKRANTASFIDVATRQIVATASTGSGPHELVVSSDGQIAVGTNYGGSDASLTVFDVGSAEVVRTIQLGQYTRPHGIAFLPDDDHVAVTSESTGNVVIVRISDGEITSAIPTQAGGSHMLGVTADGGTIWTGDMSSNTVTEIDVNRGAKVRSFSAPDVPEAVNVSPDGSRVFAGSNNTGRVTAWTTADGEATTVGEGFSWPYRVFLTPGIEQIIIPDMRNQDLRFFDGTTYEELGSIDFPGEGPQGLILHPDGQHLFLSLSAADRIAVVDIAQRSVVGYLPTGSGPDGIAYSPIVVSR